MTTEADLLGRPPLRRAVPRDENYTAFLRVPAAVQGRVSVRVPLRSSCSPVGDASQWVTLPAAPWERAG